MTALAGPRPENLTDQVRADTLTAEELGGRVHIGRVHTVRSLCHGGLVPGTSKIGHDWRVHWPTFCAALAGPSVPEGEVVTSRQLARRLRLSSRVVRRTSAAPWTPGKLPGLQLGKTCLHALPAVHAQVGCSTTGRIRRRAAGLDVHGGTAYDTITGAAP